MAKKRSLGKFFVADGAGGMTEVSDRRFDNGEWPIQFEVPAQHADSWLKYLNDIVWRRNWTCGGMSQHEAQQNSGSLKINTGSTESPQLEVTWDWRKNRSIKVRARSSGATAFSIPHAQQMFDEINSRNEKQVLEPTYCRGQLEYYGLPWRGELWLSEKLLLSPPSVDDNTSTHGPRIVVVDAVVDCIGLRYRSEVFGQLLTELSAFLSVIMGKAVSLPENRYAWVWEVKNDKAESAVKWLGYVEQHNLADMPKAEDRRQMALRDVTRPELSWAGILTPNYEEESLPSDTVELWSTYSRLLSEKKKQFLQAAAKWQEALMQMGDRPSLKVALMVVACEALKPQERTYRDHNFYDVISALFGSGLAESLRRFVNPPQNVRNAHLHGGEFVSSEFLLDQLMTNYVDPTFDQERRALTRLTQAAIIEWLARGGALVMPAKVRRMTPRRWLKENLYAVMIVTAAIGAGLGWYAARW